MTKKIARYLNWLQHDTKIFNVGERRRVATGGQGRIPQLEPQPTGRRDDLVTRTNISTGAPNGIVTQKELLDPPTIAAKILINDHAEALGEDPSQPTAEGSILQSNGRSTGSNDTEEDDSLSAEPAHEELAKTSSHEGLPGVEVMEQSASFFDPQNVRAAQIREQVAMSTLDELLDYVLDQGGSVGILDATNSTLERRKLIMKKVRQRAGPELGVLFLESLCVDPNVGLYRVPPRQTPTLTNDAASRIKHAAQVIRTRLQRPESCHRPG